MKPCGCDSFTSYFDLCPSCLDAANHYGNVMSKRDRARFDDPAQWPASYDMPGYCDPIPRKDPDERR